MIINPKYIDVDLGLEAKLLGFATGDLGRNVDAMSRFAAYRDSALIIPEADWRPLSVQIEADGGGMERLIKIILNQLQEGSCVGNGATQALMIAFAMAIGRNLTTVLSPISLYKRIGSSPGSGAMVDDALHEISTRGILPLDTPENRAKWGNAVMPATGFYTPFPNDWEKTAAYFTATQFLECRGVNEVVSALLRGFPVVVGRAGHCICYVGVVFKDGKLLIKYVNSWGEWGDRGGHFDYGFGYDSMGLINQAAQWAFAVCAPSIDPKHLA